jgi:hypothetical protein
VIEQNDEWLVARRYLSLDSLAPLLEGRSEHADKEEVLELTTPEQSMITPASYTTSGT